MDFIKGVFNTLSKDFGNSSSELKVSNYGNKVLFQVIPEDEEQQRLDNDIVCVIDISGSMAEDASVKNQQGEKEKHGMSKLDILKHAVKTTAFTLSEKDRFSLVAFNSDAYIYLESEYMDQQNKDKVSDILDKLDAEGGTNIWIGLKTALEILHQKSKQGNRHKTIILLTDGEPNTIPKEGHQQALKNQLAKFKNFDVSIQTFAFGKKTDSPLLRDLATIGEGDYSFIPCPGFIGTIFVNTLSNILSTKATKGSIKIQGSKGTLMKTDLAANEEQHKLKESEVILFQEIKYGQSRDFVVEVENKENQIVQAEVRYFDYKQGKKVQIKGSEFIVDLNKFDPMAEVIYWKQKIHKQVFKAIEKAQNQFNKHKTIQTLEQLQNSQLVIKELAGELRVAIDGLKGDNEQRLEQSKELMEKMLKDVEGEITLSFLKVEWFNLWGYHYLPSLMNAYQKQICNNFKDFGIQHYGGKLFQKIKDHSEEIFLNLPPPKTIKPTVVVNPVINNQNNQNNQNSNQQQQPQEQQQPVNQMQAYYDASGGCFAGTCLISLKGKQKKEICNLKKGDVLENGSRVVALVKISNKNQKTMKMVHFEENGLLITPNHPIKVDGKWTRPYLIKEPVFMEMQQVYNLVLDSKHTAFVNGIECVTLGHQIKEKMAYHSYFAENKVVQDLQKIPGWKNGLVSFDNSQFVRDQTNNHSINGIKI